MHRLILSAALVASLAACNVPQTPNAPEAEAQAPAQPAAPQAPAQADVDGVNCERVRTLADDWHKRRDAGTLTEADALNELRQAGDFRLAFVVDAVFGPTVDDAPWPFTLGDIMATCKRVNKTGATY